MCGEIEEMQKIETLEKEQIASDRSVINFFKIMLIILVLGSAAIWLVGCTERRPDYFRDVIMPNAWRLLADS